MNQIQEALKVLGPVMGRSIVHLDFHTYWREEMIKLGLPVSGLLDHDAPEFIEARRATAGLGNRFIEAKKREYPNATIWFDIYWGVDGHPGYPYDTASFGMTWAYNPKRGRKKEKGGLRFFWRAWSEFNDADRGGIMHLSEMQREFNDYIDA